MFTGVVPIKVMIPLAGRPAASAAVVTVSDVSPLLAAFTPTVNTSGVGVFVGAATPVLVARGVPPVAVAAGVPGVFVLTTLVGVFVTPPGVFVLTTLVGVFVLMTIGTVGVFVGPPPEVFVGTTTGVFVGAALGRPWHPSNGRVTVHAPPGAGVGGIGALVQSLTGFEHAGIPLARVPPQQVNPFPEQTFAKPLKGTPAGLLPTVPVHANVLEAVAPVVTQVYSAEPSGIGSTLSVAKTIARTPLQAPALALQPDGR
jgi:hypothetical protein